MSRKRCRVKGERCACVCGEKGRRVEEVCVCVWYGEGGGMMK